MAQNSKIEWTTAYHEDGSPQWTNKIMLVETALPLPMRRKKPQRIFVNSTSDLFHPDVPFDYIDKVFAVMALCPQHTFQVLTKRPERMREYLGEVVRPMTRLGAQGAPDIEQFTAEWMASRENSVHKQIGPMSDAGVGADPGGYSAPGFKAWNSRRLALLGRYWNRYGQWPLSNVWLGTSAEDQETADRRIPELLRCPAAVRFISYEPALGPVDFGAAGAFGEFIPPGPRSIGGRYTGEHVHWVVVGGEIGPGARPFDVQWARDVVAQCQAAGVACFVKQMGSVPVMDEAEWRGRQIAPLLRAGNRDKVVAGAVPLFYNDRKGGDINEFPEDLKVREFPEATR